MVAHGVSTSVLRWYYCSWKPCFTFNIQALKEMFPFSIKLALTGLAGQINGNIMSVLLGRFYSKYDVGIYSQGNKWAGMGSTFVNGIIQNVAQPVFVAADNRKHQRHIFRKMLRFTAFISFPALLGLALAAPELIVILITDKWLSSILILQLFCIWGAFWPINILYMQMIIAHGKSNIYLWNTVTVGIVQIIVLFSIRSMGITAMVVAFLIINFLWMGIWHFQTQRLIGLRIREVLKDIFPYLAITFISLGISYLISLYIDNIYLRCLQKISTAVVIYVALMWKMDSVIFKESVNYIFKKN
jgi:O-antigen/teichoic acid export membrane protein